MKVEMLKSNVDANILKFEALQTARAALKGKTFEEFVTVTTNDDDISSKVLAQLAQKYALVKE